MVIISKTRIKTWYGVFLIAFFAGVTAALIWSVSSDLLNFSGAATSNNNFCNETDYDQKYRGNDYYKRGTLTYQAYGYGYKKLGRQVKYTDYCETGERLREFNCVNNASRSATYKCPHGCLNGACLPPPVMKCVDGDAQARDVYGTRNTASLYRNNKVTQKVTDYCETGLRLKEATCAANAIKVVSYNCPNGCINGACKPTPSFKCVDGDASLKDPFSKKSTAVLYKNNRPIQTSTDSCVYGDKTLKKLVEYTCQNNAIIPVTKACDKRCQSGACIK